MFCQSKICKILYFLRNICKIRILHFNEYLYLDNNLSTMYMFNMSMQDLPIQVLIFFFQSCYTVADWCQKNILYGDRQIILFGERHTFLTSAE